MKSLEKRLVVGLVLALLLVFGALFWGSVTAVRALSEAYVLTRLEHDAEALLSAFDLNPRGRQRLREGRITPIYQQPLSGHYFLFAFADGTQVRSRSLWDEALPAATLQTGEVKIDRLEGPGGQRLLVRQAGYARLGQRFTLLVAEDLSPMMQHIERLQRIVLLPLGAALLIIVLVQRYLLRRGFSALGEIRDEMRQLAAGERSAIDTLGPLEIRPLTVEINRLLTQTQQRLQRSRQALGNLAHSLKAPLALLTQDIDGLALQPDTRGRLSARLERVADLIERELKRARSAGDRAGQRFVPARDVPDLLAAIQQLHRDRGLSISVTALPGRALPLDYEDMLELLGNLLDNACKWARSSVRLTIVANGEFSAVIADDGPGISEAQQVALVQRGSRLDEQREGHGLGLAIVKDLVDDYGGHVALGRSAELGGLQVTVTLPIDN